MLKVVILLMTYLIKVCLPKKTDDLNIFVFNSITEKSESKMLAKNISYECKCKFDERKLNLNQRWNNDDCWCWV